MSRVELLTMLTAAVVSGGHGKSTNGSLFPLHAVAEAKKLLREIERIAALEELKQTRPNLGKLIGELSKEPSK